MNSHNKKYNEKESSGNQNSWRSFQEHSHNPDEIKTFEKIFDQRDEEYRSAAVLFIDITGFTKLCTDLEGEQLEVMAKNAEVTFSKQKIGIASLPPLSDGNLLFVRLQQQGNSIEFTLPPTLTPGRYILSVRLVTSWDYAVVRMYFNGAQIGQTIDTYTPVIDTESVLLGRVDVNSKVNTLTLEAVARNPKSTGYCAGIDAIVLTPARQGHN